MDTLIIDSPILKRVINTVVTRMLKKKYGINPKFTIRNLSITTVTPSTEFAKEDDLMVDLNFTINKEIIEKAVYSLKEK